MCSHDYEPDCTTKQHEFSITNEYTSYSVEEIPKIEKVNPT